MKSVRRTQVPKFEDGKTYEGILAELELSAKKKGERFKYPPKVVALAKKINVMFDKAEAELKAQKKKRKRS